MVSNKKSKNAGKSNKATARPRPQARSRKQRQMVGMTGRYGLPARYPSPVGDVVPLTVRASGGLAADGSGVGSAMIVLGIGSSGAGYIFLDDLVAGFSALAAVYSRFMIRHAHLELRTVTATLSGGYAAANYEPTDSNRANVPSTLNDVSNAVHYSFATAGSPGVIDVSPSDYFNDWRSTATTSATLDPSDAQCGVMQMIGGGFTPLTASAMVFDLEIEVYFCGYRA